MQFSNSTSNELPGDRSLSRDELRQMAGMHAAIVVLYAVDAILLTLFGWLGAVSMRVGVLYGVAGVSLVLWQFAVFQRGRRSPRELELNNIVLTLGGSALMLLTALESPPVGGFMLMSVLTVLGASALQLDRRHLLLVYLACAAGAGFVLLTADASLQWPMQTASRRVLSAIWFAWLLAKRAAINIAGTQLRQRVREANLRLSAALRDVQTAAATDELTGLPNRRNITTELNDAVDAASRHPGYVGVALFDIDHFKNVNDRFGHAIGDEVLRTFGTLVSNSLRPVDRVGRYGGEEFLLVLRQLPDEHSAREAAERLRRALDAYDWSRVAEGLVVTASAGVALIGSMESSHAAIERADAALYLAKAAGRNRVMFA